MSLQDLFEIQGFTVLAYQDQQEYDEDLLCGLVDGATVNSSIPETQLLRITGPATAGEWARQCQYCDEPVYIPGIEAPHIGWLKVTAE